MKVIAATSKNVTNTLRGIVISDEGVSAEVR